ncbi:cation-translocating P-type ATPase [Longirhabdus pacifica]|uniref:cation-translocating P-type ATPase n=1 Tax=Longirhabdus pacifica TaxID=2305227 RepID=UPI001008BEA7|nr:cation-translocating P-type ATPase [Longirhabdus pacifica]
MWFTKNVQEVTNELKTSPHDGLTQQEAEERLKKEGRNEFTENQKPTVLKLIWEQINSILIYILIAAAVISAVVGEIADAIIIFIVILLNAVIGVIQESKAEKSLEALKKMSTPKAVVKRDNVVQEIPSEELVPGDLVLIDAGRYIPADIRLTETANLKIEESSLTGESLPVDKEENWTGEPDTPLANQQNMAFMSTLSTYGRGEGVVVGTGMQTEIGKIAGMLNKQEKEMTPLQRKLASLGKFLGIAAIAISCIIFFIGYLQGREVLEMFLISVSLAVAAIPEGLPAIVTIVLALGVQRMIKRNAIIRKLPAVETLGAVSVICSDKTGTLTQNKMTVTHFYANGAYEKWEPEAIQQSSTDTSKQLFLHAMVLCNDAVVTEEKEAGDPTEIALVRAGLQVNKDKRELEQTYERMYEIPFDSERKMMSTVYQVDEDLTLFAKGATESLLPRASHVHVNGEDVPITKQHIQHIHEAVDSMAKEALRVLAIAYKPLPSDVTLEPSIEDKDLVLLGLVGMIDPPREEAKDSIQQCKHAGIKTVMITGDNPKTALAIGKQLGMVDHHDEVMTGQQLEQINDEVLQEKCKTMHIFARVSPEHKVRIVQALRAEGHIVSMTGDGVNDAPSLKQADVGVAMGQSGTDVAKGAADIVLTDDNFSTIVSAVEEGRNIYQNIKKSVLFLLSCNFGEIVALFIAILLGWPAPLTAIHILWVNLITDTFPAIALGVDPDDPDAMKHHPRDPKENILSKKTGIYTVLNGTLIGLLTLIAFMEALRWQTGESTFFSIDFSALSDSQLIYAQTMAFITLSVSQLFHSLNLRHTRKSIFQVGWFSNKYLVGAIILGIGIQFVLVVTPIFNDIFNITLLSLQDWLFIIGLSAIMVVVNELAKLFYRVAKK